MSVANEEAAWQSTKDAMMLLIRELGTGAAYQLEDLRAGDLGQTLREIAMGVPEERSIANLQKGLNSLEVSTQMYQVVRKGRDEARALIAQADEALQSDDAEEAIRKYILSAELFKSIATDVEIADLLVYRAGARPQPSWEVEFEFFLGPGDTSLGAHLFGDLESLDLPSKEACRQLFRAAINVAGRAVAAIIHDDDKDPTERELDDVDRWRIYPALDVIRVSLENLPDSDAALRTVCQFYFEWEWRNGWLGSEHPADQVNPFTKKFAYSAGYLDGREVREAIGSATRLTDPPILLREMHKDIKELLARRPPSRADLASALEAEFGLLWSSVDDFVKEPMIEGESLLAEFRIRDRHDFGPAIAQYSKALEYTCVSLKRLPPDVPVLGTFGHKKNSPLWQHLRAEANTDQIIEMLKEFKRPRNEWMHPQIVGTPVRRIPLSEAQSLRNQAIHIIREITEWRKD